MRYAGVTWETMNLIGVASLYLAGISDRGSGGSKGLPKKGGVQSPFQATPIFGPKYRISLHKAFAKQPLERLKSTNSTSYSIVRKQY